MAKIRIEPDVDPANPREDYDHLGQMLCLHKRYSLLGDKHEFRSGDFDGWDKVREHIEKERGAVVVLPLYLYDHSGITMSTSPFSCPWDSGQVGFIYVTREAVLKEYSRKVVTKKLRETVESVLRAEVKEYDQYLTGDVWGYIIEDDAGEQLDSCWGFYGADYCKQAAEEALAAMKEK